ncbi:predicted protein [Chaetoceros tenuissimus]|uniref:Uncharacterized protein n=1 Tax=Chaetoceros tenuissimus TaxID=426638 RepID=A0AAD3DBP1_9STRA|nr:predicted protein [Chaetoceros tenuissimus]
MKKTLNTLYDLFTHAHCTDSDAESAIAEERNADDDFGSDDISYLRVMSNALEESDLPAQQVEAPTASNDTISAVIDDQPMPTSEIQENRPLMKNVGIQVNLDQEEELSNKEVDNYTYAVDEKSEENTGGVEGISGIEYERIVSSLVSQDDDWMTTELVPIVAASIAAMFAAILMRKTHG